MQSWFRKNSQVIGIVGVLALIVGFSLGKPPGACSVPPAPGDDVSSATNKQTVTKRNDTSSEQNEKGEQTMTTVVQAQPKVEYANESNFDQLVLRSDLPVLVDFYADWCGPCRMIAPVLEELAKETPDARIVKVDVDQASRLAARYRVSSIPNLIVFKDGDIATRHVGLASKAQLKAMLSQD
jgi:thioredoxin 1